MMWEWLARGLPPPEGFNEAIAIFPAKGDEPADCDGVIRDPAGTRPLSLKNSDNKTLAGIANWCMKRGISDTIVSSQRGFVPGRQIIDNVCDLD